MSEVCKCPDCRGRGCVCGSLELGLRAVCANCYHLEETRAEKAEDDFALATSDLREAKRERDEFADTASTLREANANLLAELRAATERAEKAEAERDEARGQAVWAKPCGFGAWIAEAPGGRLLYKEIRSGSKFWARPKSVDLMAMRFDSETEALVAGRSVPWWT